VTFRPILLTAIVVGMAVSSCAAKESKTGEAKEGAPGAQVTVNATDTGCALSASEGGTGPTTFVVTNNGTKVTEFYVYDKDGGVLEEVENISPGLQRQLAVEFKDAGPYKVACKPGMVGDGIRTDFTVKRG